MIMKIKHLIDILICIILNNLIIQNIFQIAKYFYHLFVQKNFQNCFKDFNPFLNLLNGSLLYLFLILTLFLLKVDFLNFLLIFFNYFNFCSFIFIFLIYFLLFSTLINISIHLLTL